MSSRLTDEAIASLDRLEARGESGLSTPEASRTLTEARFGLTQALREWTMNERALDTLDRALALAVHAELQRDSPSTAATILGEMRRPPALLTDAVQVATTRAADRASLAATALVDAAERDASRSASVRKAMAAVFMVATAGLVALGWVAGGSNPGAGIGYGTAFLLDVGFLLTSIAMLYLARARALVNRWSRDAVGLFLIAAIGTSMSHGVGWLRGDDIALRGDSPTQIVFAAVFGIGSFLLSKRLLGPALLACVAAIVSALWPSVSLFASALTVASAATVLALTG